MKKAAALLLGLAVGAVTTNLQNSIVTAHPLVAPTSTRSVLAATLQGRNSVTGYVFDPSRRPLADIYVELLDDVYGSIGRRRTEASGRYVFQGLSEGRYKIRVLPYGTDYREEERDIALINISIVPGSGAISEQQDFYLRVKANANAGPLAAPGTIFVQEVPGEAKKLYEQGISSLREKKEKEGFESLKRSLEIFPTYYLALDRLGTEYVMRGHHEAAFILLTKAVEVNPRGFSSLYGLGMAQYHLKLYDPAVESLRRASTLYNKTVGAQIYLGMALRRTGKPDEAEAAFKRARELSNGKVAQVHWQLAALYSEQKRYKEAADELELFLKNQPDTRDAEKIKESIKLLREKARTQ